MVLKISSVYGEEASQYGDNHETVAHDDKEKIFVTVTLSPLNEMEVTNNDLLDWECINNAIILYKNSISELSSTPNAYVNEDRQFKLKFSAMEIYNDVVRDLLTPDDTPLRLLDDPEAEYKEDRVPVDLKVPVKHILSRELQLHQSMSSVMTCLVEKRLGNKFSDNHWALRDFTEKLVALICFSVPRLGFRLLQDKLRFSYENERKSLRSVLI
ncbi:hypothetical protein CQW23_19310 [Capsicum baccatum]|uniref:TAF6 C-terminal HEAT repeat domain-containing protein n=1 Tax=Capsicum baccatum TaxID=33114 RepID=A0A2G2W5F4_CAPBA|nr:hypothetical protein CQW23_19310 [Capsicum baccatum]